MGVATADRPSMGLTVTPRRFDELKIRLRTVDRVAHAILMEQGKSVRLRIRGDHSDLLAWRSLGTGVDVEMYKGSDKFVAEHVEVIDFSIEDREVVLKGPLALVQSQRRSSFREKLSMRCRIGVKQQKSKDVALLSATTVDVSGGGVCAISYQRIDITRDQTVILEFKLENNQTIRAICRVAWVLHKGDSATTIGLEFSDINQGHRDALYAFLYSKQREKKRGQLEVSSKLD